MSLLQEVFHKYGISENPEPPTDKTDRSPFVSSVSESLEDFEKQFPDAEEHEIPAILDSIRIGRMRDRGIVPDHYTASTECEHCGPVPIFEGLPEKVKGCPWCFNRIKGQPIPGVNTNG